MRLVDAKMVKSKAECYNYIPQPMPVYHSTEELRANEPNAEICSSFEETLAWLKEKEVSIDYRGVTTVNRIRSLLKYNLWFKTVDKFVPDYADLAGVICYKTTDNGEFIPTDGCYIRAYFLIPLSTKLVFYTSAGVNSINMMKWEVTAAVRTQFQNEKDLRKSSNKEVVRQENLDRLLRRRKGSTNMYQFVFALFSPQSSMFLNIDKSASFAFGSTISSKDRYKIFASESFRRAMIQIMKILMPELKKAVLSKFNAEQMAEMLATAYTKAEEGGKVADILAVFDKIKSIAYEEETTVNDTTMPDLPRITDGREVGKPKEISLPADVNGDTMPSKLELTKKEMEELKEDLDYPDAFIALDVSELEGSITEEEIK